MPKMSRGLSPANRQAQRERAQAQAMDELEFIAARQREKTNKLRKLRLGKEAKSAAGFEKWRVSQFSNE